MRSFRFKPAYLPAGTADMRAEVRAFLAENLADYPSRLRAGSWAGYNEAFSAKVGQAGFLGLASPREYGGHGRAAFERYVMLEAMLAAGAPVLAHWIADRESGPLILKSGMEDMKRRIVSAIVRGEAFFASACRSRAPAPISPRSAPRPAKRSSACCSTTTRFGPPAPIEKVASDLVCKTRAVHDMQRQKQLLFL